MNTTVPSATPLAAEVPLTRAQKEQLLKQMYFLPHWIALIRFFGYQTIPMDQARESMKPLVAEFGKEPVAKACEILVEISMKEKEAFARLKPHIRRMAFQILGPEPSTDTVTPTAASPPPGPHPKADSRRPVQPRKSKKPAKRRGPITGWTRTEPSRAARIIGCSHAEKDLKVLAARNCPFPSFPRSARDRGEAPPGLC